MKIELSDKQADILIAALDLYSRIHLGQFEEVANIARMYDISKLNKDYEAHNEFEDAVREAKIILGFDRNGSYGIFNEQVNDVARIAWDMQQVIRNHLAWKRNPEGGFTVNFDAPHHSSKENLINITEGETQ